MGPYPTPPMRRLHPSLCLLFSYFFHSLFKLEQTVLLVKLLRHVRVWMILIEELDGIAMLVSALPSVSRLD
jgi:hypothetical protein